MLSFTASLIRLRQEEPALHIGDYAPVYTDSQAIAYTREAGEKRFLIVLNLTHRPFYFNPEHEIFSGTIAISTYLEREGAPISGTISLSGDEGVVVRLDA